MATIFSIDENKRRACFVIVRGDFFAVKKTRKRVTSSAIFCERRALSRQHGDAEAEVKIVDVGVGPAAAI